VTLTAQGAGAVFEKLTASALILRSQPKWSDKPLLKSVAEGEAAARLAAHYRLAVSEVRAEIRQQIIDGKLPHEILLNERVGEIKAQIIERDGKILMVKDCPKHGHFEDVMSIDTASSSILKRCFRAATFAPTTTTSCTTTVHRR